MMIYENTENINLGERIMLAQLPAGAQFIAHYFGVTDLSSASFHIEQKGFNIYDSRYKDWHLIPDDRASSDECILILDYLEEKFLNIKKVILETENRGEVVKGEKMDMMKNPISQPELEIKEELSEVGDSESNIETQI